MKITRRHLLALSAATAAATGLLAGGTVYRWWDQPPDGAFAHLTDDEAAFLRSFSGAAFPSGDTIPLSGADAGIDVFFDAVLGGMPELTGNLLKLLAQALERATLLSHGGHFTALPLDVQQSALKMWMHSDIAEIRGAVTSLVVLLGMGYTTHPEVSPIMSAWHRCGYGR